MDVAITGLGLVTPLGIGVDACVAALRCGRGALGPAPELVPAGFGLSRVGAVTGLDPDALLVENVKGVKFMSREALFATCAARLAFDDARLDGIDRERLAVFLGTGYEPRLFSDYGDAIAASHDAGQPFDRAALERRGLRAMDPSAMLRSLSNMAAAHVSIELGAAGVNAALTPSLAAGGQALHEAIDAIDDGDADVVVAGGADAKTLPMELATILTLGILSRTDDPVAACAPMAREARGTVLGEGAALFVLERRAHALARGAAIRGTLRGVGETSWPAREHAPEPTVDAMVDAMRLALARAELAPDGVDVVHVAAAGWPGADAIEAEALARVFGSEVPPLVSVKPRSGHLLAASIPWEVAATLLWMESGGPAPALPGTARDDLGLRCAARDRPPRVALVSGIGLTGQVVSVVVEGSRAA